MHYVEFWTHNTTDVVHLLEQLHDKRTYAANQQVAQRIVANSLHFANTHLTNDTTYAYWQAVIDKHAALYRVSKEKSS